MLREMEDEILYSPKPSPVYPRVWVAAKDPIPAESGAQMNTGYSLGCTLVLLVISSLQI